MELVGIRNTLRAKNLYDTGVPDVTEVKPLPPHPNVEVWRTADGTSNDLRCPFMGSAGTRFGRNAPLKVTWQEPMPAVMTPSPRMVSHEEIRRVYEVDIDRVDLIVDLFAETPPKGFGFSDTAFRIFVLMASRRLNSDRPFTTDFAEEIYSKAGMDWIRYNTMSTILLRHFPGLELSLRGVRNAFAP